MIWQYQEHGAFFAQCADGLEETASEELAMLGAREAVPAYRGIRFRADMTTLYRLNYESRLCSRILAPLITFDCHSTKYLHRTATGIDWESLFDVDRTFMVTSTVSQSLVRHSQYAALCLKDAVVDRFRERTGRRPDVERLSPDITLDLHIERNRATISLDTSGGSLHRRGYRTGGFKAPMQETVAAAIIRMSGWDGATPLRDPMCGSGTLLAEALMSCSRIPAGYLRERFGFESMPGFSREDWMGVRGRADAAIRPLPGGLLEGSDVDPEAVSACRRSLSGLPSGDDVPVVTADFETLEGFPSCTIVTNPPYGMRMGDRQATGDLLKRFGDFLKRRCPGSTAFVYFGDRSLMGSIGLRPAWRRPLRSGQLDGRLARFDMIPLETGTKPINLI